MTIRGTMNTATQALLAQSQFLSNISTNIANVNTTGYKAQNTHFQTLLNHTSPGGLTPRKFFTVDTVDSREVSRQGFLNTTNRTLDLAINGRGFFVTNTETDGSGIWQYTRDGALYGESTQLTTDSDNDGQLDQATLLKTGSGAYVFGWKADDDGNFNQLNDLTALTPISINSNEVFPSRATANLSLQANVSAGVTNRQTVGMQFIDAAGNSRTVTIGFSPTDTQTGGFKLDVNIDDINGQNVPNTTITLLDANGDPIPPDLDADGNPLPPQVQFDGQGQLIVPQGGKVLIETTEDSNDPTATQSMVLDMRKVQSFNDNGEITVFNSDQDGFLEGRLVNTYFDQFGVLYGSYTNQGERALFKLPIATFAAENNLEAQPGNYFTQTREAGDRKLNGLDHATGLGQIVAGALESSNVDLADQFSKMIITQRAYSSSATVLRTADEMMQQTRDLKR
ncbi:MAG: flagellar hook-basal body complex protein [Rhodospirillaceae bacterium]|nr:flagellar hook-basal body complex protein [Rhodospirillaceae bacterium]